MRDLKEWTEKLVGLAITGHSFEETIERIGPPPSEAAVLAATMADEAARLRCERDEARAEAEQERERGREALRKGMAVAQERHDAMRAVEIETQGERT